MAEKIKTIKLPEAQLNTLAYYVSKHTMHVESEQRWNEDRDESFEWRDISDNVSHLAYCRFRKQITGDSPVEIALPTNTWRKIQALLRAEKKRTKLHPLYTQIYPQQIKRFKFQIKALQVGKVVDPGLTKDVSKLQESVAYYEERITLEKQKHLSDSTKLMELMSMVH